MLLSLPQPIQHTTSERYECYIYRAQHVILIPYQSAPSSAWASYSSSSSHQVVSDALLEDAGGIGDITTLATIAEDTQAEATFLAKADGILAGLGLCDLIFEIVDPNLVATWSASDGAWVERGREFGLIKGSARSILVAERIALNFMQR